MDIRNYVRRSIVVDQRQLKRYRSIANTYPGLKLKSRIKKKTGFIEYYCVDSKSGKESYLSIKEVKTILALQRKYIARKLVKNLEHNIKCKMALCEKLLPDSISEISSKVPLTYRPNERLEKAEPKRNSGKKIPQSENPYKREELTKKTSFGLYVRTKGELAIAELLYSLGIEFYYERSLILHVERIGEDGRPYWIQKTYYPDFMIALPDGSYIYWEHKGYLSDSKYVQRNIQKELDYNMNNIYAAHNLIITAEGPENKLDMEGITRVVEGWLMPLLDV